jgi:hypothetical protein
MVFKTKLVLFFIKSFLLIILFSNNIICSDDKKDVIFVLEVFSNGIISSKTNESNQDVLGEFWLKEKNLTNLGIRQQYLLGINDKNTYQNFLIDETFNPKDILIKSKNSSENIQSAYSHLHGIYNPPNGQKFVYSFNTSIIFPNYNNLNENDTKDIDNMIEKIKNDSAVLSGVTIVPVHIFDFDLNDKEKCPNYFKLKKNNIEKNKEKFKNIIYKKFNETFGDLFLQAFNKDESFFQNPENLMLYLNTFIIDYITKRKIKSLENKNLDLKYLYEYAKDLIQKYTLNIEFDYDYNENENLISKIQSSPILKSLFYYADLRIDYDSNGKRYKKDSKRPKFVLFSVGNEELNALQKKLNETFNIELNYMNDFSSSINFEVFKKNNESNESNEDNDYEINIIYNGDSKKNISYDEFKNKFTTNLWDDDQIKKFCKEKDVDKYLKQNKYNMNIILLFWSISAIILVFLYFSNRFYINYSNRD